MKRAYLTLTAIALASLAHAQSYWQQKIDTRIQVSLDDKNHYLHGEEELTYTNNSPDTLRYIYMHLWPNAYKHDHTPFAEQEYENGNTDFYYAKAEDRGFIDSLNFIIDGTPAEYTTHSDTPDVAFIKLPKPLPPNASMTIQTPFRVKLPKVFSRLGHTGQAYFISQWFPKPAVYDKRGWHPMPYLSQGEFYSEFGSYDVSITLPKNYVLMGTGMIMNEEERRWLDELAQKPVISDSLQKTSKTPISTPPSVEELKTVTFRAENVHDFAWFADKRWMVKKDTVTIEGNSEPITAYAAYQPTSNRFWKHATDYLKLTVRHYSDYVGPYRYNTITAVEGDMEAGGGMEYPTITVIDRGANSALKEVIVHEAGHNWFYGILGSNERIYPWMDEGVNSFYERKTMQASRPEHLRNKDTQPFSNILYYYAVTSNTDQALNNPSTAYTYVNYGGDVYYKSAMMLKWLEQYLGEETFEKAMQAYYNQWKFKHPYPEDFKTAFENNTDKPVDWFFNDVLNTTDKIDFKIVKAKGNEVTIKNKGNFAAPTGIAIYADSVKKGEIYTAPFQNKTKITLPTEYNNWDRLQIASSVPDANITNNRYKRNGLFHNGGLSIRPFVGPNWGYKDKVFVLPSLGFNYYDGFQAGLIVHNITIPQNRFRFILMPQYGFRSGEPIGAGTTGYFFYPKRAFREILLQADFKSYHFNETGLNIPEIKFARYIKVAPSLNFTIKEKSLRSPVTRTITLKGYGIKEDEFDFNNNYSDSLFRAATVQRYQYYGLFRYSHTNARTFNPFSYSIEGQLGEDFAKINLEGNLRIDYNVPKKSLYVRAFAGKFFAINNTPGISRYYLNTTYTGVNDYLYDGTYIGRNERDGFSGRQLSIEEGGFKIPTPFYSQQIGRSDDWLVALNLKTDLPLGWLPLRLFADVGTFASADKLNPSGNKILFDAGIEAHIPGDRVVVYIPLLMSKDFKDYFRSIHGDNYFGKSIVFSIRIRDLNWLKASETIIKSTVM